MNTFLFLFGVKTPTDLNPVCLYAGVEHQDRFAAFKAASEKGGYDHFLEGNTGGATVRVPAVPAAAIAPAAPAVPPPTDEQIRAAFQMAVNSEPAPAPEDLPTVEVPATGGPAKKKK